MRTPSPANTNPASPSPIERIAGYHWEAFNAQPVKVAKRSAPSGLAKVRGTYKRGNYMERTGLLGTFVADPRQIERVTFGPEVDGARYALIVRNRWESWGGTLTPAQWDTLRAHLPNAEWVDMAARSV